MIGNFTDDNMGELNYGFNQFDCFQAPQNLSQENN